MLSSTRQVHSLLAQSQPEHLAQEHKEDQDSRYHIVHIHDNEGCNNYVIDISPEDEVEECIIQVAAPLPTVVELPPLHYLHILEDDELVALEKQYGKTRYEFDELVVKNPRLFWWYRIDFCLANSSNLLYILFQINTSNEGIIQFANTIRSGTNLSNDVAYGIGIPTSVLDTGLYTVIFSAYKEAVKATLEYLFSKSLREQVEEEIAFVKRAPQAALRGIANYLFNQAILYTSDLTGVMTEIIDLVDKIFSLPTPLNWMVIAGILRYGKRYYTKYMDDNYLEGRDFWHNKDSRPWLYQEILRGNIAIPMQILLQGASSIGLRAYPYYYYLAQASATALGWWPSPLFVVPVVVWHSLCAFYPETFNHYMKDKEKVEAYIAQQFDLLPHLNLSPDDLVSEKRKAIDDAIKLYQIAVTEKHGRLFLLKNDSSVVAPLLYRTAVSSYIGYEFALLFSVSSVALPVVSALVFAGIFGGGLYKAEANRVMYKLMNQFIEETNSARRDEAAGATPKTYCEIMASLFGKILNVSGALSGAMSTLGTSSRLSNGSSLVNASIAIIAIERALNTIKFNAKKVEKTMRALLVPKTTAAAPSTLFHHNRNNVPESKQQPVDLPALRV